MRAGDEFTPDERARLAGVEGRRLVGAVNESLADAGQSYWREGREARRGEVFTRVQSELAAASGLVASRAELEEVYFKARMSRQRVLPGALDLLRALAHRGVKTGLVSNCVFSPEAVDGYLASRRLRGLFDVVVTSSQVGWRKPRPEPFQAAVGRLGLTPGDCAFVGDDWDADVGGALGAGLSALWFWGQHPSLETVPVDEPHGPGEWPRLADHPRLAADVAAVGGRLIGAARTLADVGALLGAGAPPD